MTSFKIRATKAHDLPGLREVVDQTGLFPGDMLKDLVQPALHGNSDVIWLSGLIDDVAIGLCYAEPEPLADRVWNMRALAVLPAHQGQGLGGRIVAGLEDRLRAGNHRLIIVDTSGTEDFALTRHFYRGAGYDEAARIRDYWSEGDDKVVFRKRLMGAS